VTPAARERNFEESTRKSCGPVSLIHKSPGYATY
jgi:hypothetical protein